MFPFLHSSLNHKLMAFNCKLYLFTNTIFCEKCNSKFVNLLNIWFALHVFQLIIHQIFGVLTRLLIANLFFLHNSWFNSGFQPHGVPRIQHWISTSKWQGFLWAMQHSSTNRITELSNFTNGTINCQSNNWSSLAFGMYELEVWDSKHERIWANFAGYELILEIICPRWSRDVRTLSCDSTLERSLVQIVE